MVFNPKKSQTFKLIFNLEDLHSHDKICIYMICATSKLDITCRKKQMFKSWGILEAGACDHEPGPPWNRAEHNSCIAWSHMKLLSSGAEHCGAHPLPTPSQGLHGLHILQPLCTNNRRHHQLSPQDFLFPPLQIIEAPF